MKVERLVDVSPTDAQRQVYACKFAHTINNMPLNALRKSIQGGTVMRHSYYLHRHSIRTLPLTAVLLSVLLALMLSMPITAAQEDEFQFIPVVELDPQHAVDWMDLLYRRIEVEGVSAPGAARIYGYAGVSMYEALLGGMIDNRTMAGQIEHMPDLPFWEEDVTYDWLSVMDSTLGEVLPALFYKPDSETTAAFEELLETHTEARIEEVGEQVVEDSHEYGQVLAEALIEWIEEDGFLDMREMLTDYELPIGDGVYTLTDDFPAPVEPYWGNLRPFVMYDAYECHQYMDLQYSTDPASTFYKQAQEVMDVERDLTEWERETARYWVDTPGQTGTPAGHWWSIATQLVDQLELTLDDTAMMYAMLGPALADSFISCWSLKYETLIPRPVTYIQENIRRRWQPYIQTPPFPEYPSGHSVVSGAAVEVLTSFFGTVAFEDETHIIYDHEPLRRSYTSFEAAATEAAISRLYGGIHYRAAIENGLRQGRCVGNLVNNRLILRPVGQGGE
jgi:hypothetical protein